MFIFLMKATSYNCVIRDLVQCLARVLWVSWKLIVMAPLHTSQNLRLWSSGRKWHYTVCKWNYWSPYGILLVELPLVAVLLISINNNDRGQSLLKTIPYLSPEQPVRISVSCNKHSWLLSPPSIINRAHSYLNFMQTMLHTVVPGIELS